MSLSHTIRQSHRWVSVVFTLTVVANFVAMGLGSGQPPAWITYAPGSATSQPLSPADASTVP